MQAKYIAIKPKPSDNITDCDSHDYDNLQCRKQVDHACERCRRKRVKVCFRHQTMLMELTECATSVDEKCEYSMSKFASKEKLRAEIERLQNIITESKTPSTSEDIQSAVTERDGNDSLRTLSTNASKPDESHQDHELATAFDQLLSWRQCRHDVNYETVNSETLTRISLPPSPLDIYSSDSGVDTWTCTNWTKAHVLQLGAIFAGKISCLDKGL